MLSHYHSKADVLLISPLPPPTDDVVYNQALGGPGGAATMDKRRGLNDELGYIAPPVIIFKLPQMTLMEHDSARFPPSDVICARSRPCNKFSFSEPQAPTSARNQLQHLRPDQARNCHK